MKLIKTGLALSVVLLSFAGHTQTHATAASPVDCNGTTHDLFAELDAGKIIVIGWTMPCATCAAPLLQVHNSVLNFAVSNPGVVEYWVNDDYANTSCSSVEGWCSTNGITNATFFSTSEIPMSHYGTDGMPKVVVLGCTDHKVYYNVNNSPTGMGVTAAINTALADIAASCVTGNEELEASTFDLACYPNPANTELTVSFNSKAGEQASLEVLDVNGASLKQFALENSNKVTTSVHVDVNELVNGFYFLKMTSRESTEIIKFQIIH